MVASQPANFVSQTILYIVNPERRTGSPLIFIVDDDLDHTAICRELLEARGYLVEEVGDGRKALARLLDPDREQPALILLDLSMPLMDGWQFLAIMKSYIRLHLVPVVLISAEEPRLEPERHGTIAAQLRKPYDAEQLLAIASRYVPLTSASADPA
ncbi:MAG TPA: response regulator [Polyangia bacterium]